MQARTVGRYVRVPPRKALRVAQLIKGKPTREALALLRMMPNKPARLIHKLLKVAIGNAEHNYEMNKQNLYVADVRVDQGPVMKRWWPRARMRVDRIRKRTSHITIVVEEGEKG